MKSFAIFENEKGQKKGKEIGSDRIGKKKKERGKKRILIKWHIKFITSFYIGKYKKKESHIEKHSLIL